MKRCFKAYPGKKVSASKKIQASVDHPIELAERIRDDLEEFLDWTSQQADIDDYLDEEDMHALATAQDAFNYFCDHYKDIDKE